MLKIAPIFEALCLPMSSFDTICPASKKSWLNLLPKFDMASDIRMIGGGDSPPIAPNGPGGAGSSE